MRKRFLHIGRLLAVLALVLLGLGTGRLIWVTTNAPPPAAQSAADLADINGRFVTVRGVTLYTVEAGPTDGEPIVLVHGLLGSTQDFAELVPAMAAQGYRVLAVDRPPFGLSDKRAEAPMTAATQADLLVAWLEALGIAQATWLGHSAGGAVVAQVALRHPARASKLVLVAPQIGGAAAGDGRGRSPLANPALPALLTIFLHSLNPISPWAEAELRAHFTDARLRDFLQAQLSTASVSDAMAADEARFTRVQEREAGLRAFGRAALSDRAPLRVADLSALRMPVLIAWGEDDAFVPIAAGRQLRDAIPGSAWVSYPRAGHQPWRDAPQAFIRDLTAFLATPVAITALTPVNLSR